MRKKIYCNNKSVEFEELTLSFIFIFFLKRKRNSKQSEIEHLELEPNQVPKWSKTGQLKTTKIPIWPNSRLKNNLNLHYQKYDLIYNLVILQIKPCRLKSDTYSTEHSICVELFWRKAKLIGTHALIITT